MSNELILIVEDNPKNLKLVRDTLQVKGYQTIEAETGEEGVQLARERRPALILMDIQLPGMSGIEAFGELRADSRASLSACGSSWRRCVGSWRDLERLAVISRRSATRSIPSDGRWSASISARRS